jgi:hypothetical protein
MKVTGTGAGGHGGYSHPTGPASVCPALLARPQVLIAAAAVSPVQELGFPEAA